VAGGRTGAGEALSFFFDGAGDELRLGAMLVGKTPGPDPFLKKTLALEGRLDRSLPSVESQKFENRVRRKNHQRKNRRSSEKGTGNAVPSKRFHLVHLTHSAKLR
jgi:hypothetical protein